MHYWLIWHKCQRACVIMNCPSCVVVVVGIVVVDVTVLLATGYSYKRHTLHTFARNVIDYIFHIYI